MPQLCRKNGAKNAAICHLCVDFRFMWYRQRFAGTIVLLNASTCCTLPQRVTHTTSSVAVLHAISIGGKCLLLWPANHLSFKLYLVVKRFSIIQASDFLSQCLQCTFSMFFFLFCFTFPYLHTAPRVSFRLIFDLKCRRLFSFISSNLSKLCFYLLHLGT